MKTPELQNDLAIKRCPGIFRGILVVILGCLSALSSSAEVHVVRFDPPLSVNAFANPAPGLDWSTTAFDFDLDGQTDFRLTYGEGVMNAFFNTPTRFGTKALSSLPPPVGGGPVPFIPADDLGPVSAVPLGSMIGSNIVSSVSSNYFVWGTGVTNDYLPELLGNYTTYVISANLTVATWGEGPFFALSTNGTWVTNIYYPNPVPVIDGDVVGKEGVMALQFYIGTELHYGYIHFDFNAGAGGVIYGCAYETEPNVPIKAMPLLPGEKLTKQKINYDLPVPAHQHEPGAL